MLNNELIKSRLSQYGAVWLGAFALAAVIFIGGPMALGADVIGLADAVLPVAFAAIGLLLIGYLVLALTSGQTLGTKLVLLLLTLLLALPLLWSPVLAAVAGAFFAERSIEYSAVYARFRIIVGDLLFPVIQSVFSGALFEQVWILLQVFASAVGVISAIAKAWPWIRRFLGREEASASTSDIL